MLKEGIEMEGGNEKIQEELREVQKEVEDAEEKSSSTTSTARRLEQAEEGNMASPVHALSSSAGGNTGKLSLTNRKGHRGDKGGLKGLKDGIANLAQLFLNPILVQTFIMTFLAEWGDRSQISTIALAAAHVSWDLLIYKFTVLNAAFFASAERLHRHYWHSHRASDLYSRSCDRRSVSSYQDFRQARHSRRCGPILGLWCRIRVRGAFSSLAAII